MRKAANIFSEWMPDMNAFAPKTPTMLLTPIVLSGEFARLEPLEQRHFDGLNALVEDAGERIFANSPLGPSFKAYFDGAMAARKPDSHLPFVVREQSSDAYVGMTRLFDIHPEHRGLEIGYTWYHPAFWGGAINPECKLLLMRHAFEEAGYGRIQLKTDARNTHSQAAMIKLGASREGVLRKHMVLPDGRWRDSMYFSVLAEEWPTVKTGLERRLADLRAEIRA